MVRMGVTAGLPPHKRGGKTLYCNTRAYRIRIFHKKLQFYKLTFFMEYLCKLQYVRGKEPDQNFGVPKSPLKDAIANKPALPVG